MNRQIDSASRLIPFQELKRNWIKHEERLMHIKPTLNTRNMAQRYLSSRKCNYSKSLEIELQNKALLKKLTDKADHRSDQSIYVTTSLPKSNRKRFYDEYKKKCQNQGLYKRLKQIRPMIDTDRMLSQRKITQKYLNTISKFGYKGLKPNKTQLKFDMKNNELKYLSKRKILLQSRVKENQENSAIDRIMNDQKIIDEEYNKMRRNQQLFSRFIKPRPLVIDKHRVLLKIREGSRAITLQLKDTNHKQNLADPFELQVKIQKKTFEGKFKRDLEGLLSKLRYNQNTRDFYIL